MFIAFAKDVDVKINAHAIPTMNAGQTGTLRPATRTIGINGVNIASPPLTPVSCVVLASCLAGAENANLIPFFLNSTKIKISVATAVATMRYISKLRI